MEIFHHHKRRCGGRICLLGAWLLALPGAVAMEALQRDPISRIARIFNPQLVDLEERLDRLNVQLAACSQQYEHALKTGLGYRGCRSHEGAPDPSITLDLGGEMAIRTVFLIPAQRDHAQDPGIFPKRFTLELSTREDFAQRSVLFTSGATMFLPPKGVPVSFPARDSARYVRLTIQEGHNQGVLDLFALSELVVIAGGEPVSFGATVTTAGDFNAPGIWYPAALIDGRTPLGIWENGGKPNIEPGDAVIVSRPGEPTTWSLELERSEPLDRIVLFPYHFSRSSQVAIFPDSLAIRLATDGDAGNGEIVFEWTNPLPGVSQMTPLVIPLHGQVGRAIQLTALRPASVGSSNVHALSEIQVWSHGRNLAQDRQVLRQHAGETTAVSTLTDGYSSSKLIIPPGTWLHQLHERSRLENELAPLRSLQRELATNSELNATWGSAMILGLTFLIPVFIVERRRLMTKDELDQIRKRISADLHDDIGSNLGSISLIARTAHKDLLRLEGPREIALDLAEVETIARESSLAMRDIVWLLERQQDSVGDLVQRMRETAGRLLRGIEFSLECDSTKTTTRLSLDSKRHLFLFYKESVHNILKHSKASRVAIRLWDEGDKLAMEISDNGVGIPLVAEARPAAVNKLEDRARVMNGHMQITSSKEAGTRIRLLVKRCHLTSRPIRS